MFGLCRWIISSLTGLVFLYAAGKVRRLYDIANVLASMKFIEKVIRSFLVIIGLNLLRITVQARSQNKVLEFSLKQFYNDHIVFA